MNLHIITQDSRIKSQLSLLFRELGHLPVFHPAAGAFLDNAPSADTTPVLFIDLAANAGHLDDRRIKTMLPGATLIGFQAWEPSGAATPVHEKPESMDAFFLLPPHADRAKARLKSLLREHSVSGTLRRNTPAPGNGFFRRPARLLHSTSLRMSRTSESWDPPNVRYLEASSAACQDFVHRMRKMDDAPNLVVFNGREGAEFELAARELNYQKTRDAAQLIVRTSEELSIDSLEQLEKTAAKERVRKFCYVGKTDDLSPEAAHHLMLFAKFLDNLRNPHLCIVLAHEHGTKPFFHEGVQALLKPAISKSPSLEIPDLAQRPEDIRPIALTLLASLRAAHPFLRVSGIQDETLAYLQEIRTDLSHAKLVRVLRNALALSSRDSLTVEDIKNYGEHDTSTSHLVESMADEEFFPNTTAVNL